MATTFISCNTGLGNIHIERTCENCTHWQMNGPVYAYQGDIPCLVGQCRAAETTNNETAPRAETGFVFTQAHNRCELFGLHPDMAAYHADMAVERAYDATSGLTVLERLEAEQKIEDAILLEQERRNEVETYEVNFYRPTHSAVVWA
jgi:hypothetical protein